MKSLIIYDRVVLERTGYKKYPFKEDHQISLFYDGKEIKNHSEIIDNPKLKVKFVKVFETRKKSELETYIAKLGRSDADKWLKANLNSLIEEKKDAK